jgi:pre-mRNA-processing factor 19
MAAVCSISSTVPEEPVVSLKSGHVFEKRLILKHLKQSGNVCPVTKQDLHPEDLLALKSNESMKPRPPSAASIPGMIQLFQNEWDALMLETFTLKQHLHTVRQELAHALYQHDAACRVIARLIKERDAARSALEGYGGEKVPLGAAPGGAPAAAPAPSASASGGAGVGEMEIDVPSAAPAGSETGINQEVVENMNSTAKKLAKGRKKRVKQLQADVSQRSSIKKYGVLSSHPLHGAAKQGIFCLDIHPTEEDLVLTGGLDANVILFNRKTGKIVDTLKGHKKRITSVVFHPTERLIFTTSQDHTGAIWSATDAGKFDLKQSLTAHTDEVIGATLHPSGSYLVMASKDKTWSFYDVPSGNLRQKVMDSKIDAGFTRISFHPDGLILGGGTADSLVRIFDVKEQKNVANFRGHTGQVTGISFSENGYYLASADEQGTVKLWDLRKLQNFHTISGKELTNISDISFDLSGSYLGIACEEVVVYQSKGWELVKNFNDHKGSVTGVRFGAKGNFFASTSKDRTLKFWGPKEK